MLKRSYRIGALIISLLLPTFAGLADEMKLKLPYRPTEVSHCYERIKQSKPVLQNAVKEIQSILESSAPFDERIKKAMDVHATAIKEAQKAPSNTTFVEEDIYLCCAYDIVEAAFANETERVVNAAEDSAKKNSQLDHLMAIIESLPFKSPQYQTVIRPRLEKKVTQAKDEM